MDPGIWSCQIDSQNPDIAMPSLLYDFHVRVLTGIRFAQNECYYHLHLYRINRILQKFEIINFIALPVFYVLLSAFYFQFAVRI